MADNETKNENTTETDVPGDTPQEDEKLKCDIKVEESGPWKKKISITIGRDAIDKELNGQYKELLKTADVPGFRKGRAPRRLVEKRFGENVSEQSKLKLIAQAIQQVEEEQKFDILTEPDFDVSAISIPEAGDLTFDYEIEVKPEFELPKLEGIKVEKQIVEINDERIDESIKQLCRRFGRTEHIEEGKAQDDDLVICNVTMKVEGEDEPEKREGMPVRVGSTAVMGVMIEDMSKHLKGVEMGKTVTCSAEVPDTHPREAIRGKKAEFTLETQSIDRMIVAELNHEFFNSLGVADEADLRKLIEEDLELRGERESRDLMKQQVSTYLDEQVKFDLPIGVAARHATRLLTRRYYELLQQGVPQNLITENLERLKASTSEQSAHQLKMSFVLDRVSDDLEIEVTEPEVNGMIAQIAANYRRRPERVREEMQREGRLEMLRDQIRHEKALDKLLEMAEVVDAPAKADKKTKAKKTAKKADKADDEKVEEKKADDEKEDTKKADQKKAPKKTSSRKEVNRKPPSADK